MTHIEWTDTLSTTQAVLQVVAAATAWVEEATDHPNLWSGDTDKELIRAVRRLTPAVRLRWLEDPQYAGWVDHTAPPDEDRPQHPVGSVLVTEFRLCPLSEANASDWQVWTVRVRRHRDDLWAVESMFEVLNQSGGWGIDPISSNSGEAWEQAHCFDLPTALRLAERAQWTLRVNGKTAANVLARAAAGRPV